MKDNFSRPVRIPSGVPGLDAILEGGLLRSGVYIIEGPPGAGKTTLGAQFAFTHASAGGRAVYVTLLAESYSRLLGHISRMAFFQPSLVPERITFLSAFKVLEAEGLESLLSLIRRTLIEQSATALVLDGLVSAEEASRSPRDFKKFIHELQTVTAMTGCTALLLNSTERPGGFRPELTMVDGVLELSDAVVGLKAVRKIVVRKMRGTAQLRGKHTVEISDAGMRVVPRLESTLGLVRRELPSSEQARAAFGIPELDAMLRGGLPRRTMTAIAGPPGSGKSTLCLQFLSEGAKKGEPVVYFGMYDSAPVVLAKSQRLGLSLGEAHAQDRVHIVEQAPVEACIDTFVDRLLAAVRRVKATRLCIDGSQGFEIAADTPNRLREVFCALDVELARLGVTTVYTMETQPLFSREIDLSATGMSASTQNILLLAHVPEGDELQRYLTVLKVRDSAHDSCIRKFEITDRGIVLGSAPVVTT